MYAKNEVMLSCGMLSGWIIVLLGATSVMYGFVRDIEVPLMFASLDIVPLISHTHSIN